MKHQLGQTALSLMLDGGICIAGSWQRPGCSSSLASAEQYQVRWHACMDTVSYIIITALLCHLFVGLFLRLRREEMPRLNKV